MSKDIKKLIEEALIAIEEPANASDIAFIISRKTRKKHGDVLKNVRQALRSDRRSEKVLECNGYYYMLQATESCLRKIEEEERGQNSLNVPLHRRRRNKKSEPMETTTVNTGGDTGGDTDYCTCTSTSSLQFFESVTKRDTNLIEKKQKVKNRKLSAEDRKKIRKPNTRKQLKSCKSAKCYNLRERPQKMLAERPQKMLAVTIDRSKPRNKTKQGTKNNNKYCTCSSDDKLDDLNASSTKPATLQNKRLKSNQSSNAFVDETDSVGSVGFVNSNSYSSILDLVDLIEHTKVCAKCNQKVLAYTAELKRKYDSSSYNLSSNLNLNKQNENRSTTNNHGIKSNETNFSFQLHEPSLNIDSISSSLSVLNRNGYSMATESKNEAIVSNLEIGSLSDTFKEELIVNGKINDDQSEPKNNFEDRDDEDDRPSTSQQAIEKYFQNYRFFERKGDDDSVH